MKNKKLISCISTMFVCTLLIGCANENSNKTQRYDIPLGTASSEDTVTQIYAEKFAEEVERLSNGDIRIQVYANSVIGGDRELLESCKSGDIPFVVQNTAPQVSFMPKLSIFDLPCAYYNIEDVRAAIDDEYFYGLIQNVYDEAGYTLLGYADQEFRVMSSNKNVKDIDDFHGIKIRTMENSHHIAFWKALGANPTPMTFSEVYIGLQQGTIDAQENPYEVIVSSKLYEQQDYVINTNHLPHLISLIVSNEFYSSLPVEQQQIIIEASEIAKQYARMEADSRIEQKTKEIISTGTEIIVIPDELMEDMKDRSQSVYETIREIAGEELVKAYLGNVD